MHPFSTCSQSLQAPSTDTPACAGTSAVIIVQGRAPPRQANLAGTDPPPPAPAHLRRPGVGTEADAYVERVRRLTERLAARDVGPDDASGALDAVRGVVVVDVDAPTASTRPEARLLKTGVKRLTAWYLAYLAEQVNDLGFALLRLGETLAARADRAEAASGDLGARLDQLEDRVHRLEGTQGRGKDAGNEA